MAYLASGKLVTTALRFATRRSIPPLRAARCSDPIARHPLPSLPTTNFRSLYQTSRRHSTAATLKDVPREYFKYPLPDDCQVIKLPDNRLLSYAEYGSKAPNAHPFIFIHGIPDTRLDACLLPSDQALAEKLNIRWIGIDRPGIGLSTFHPNRTVLGWVDDLKHLIQHLELTRYRIYSISGGTGYALACAKLLPREQLRSLGIGFGIGPWEAGLKGMSLFNRMGCWVWHKHPWVFREIIDRFVIPEVLEESPKKTEEMIRNENKCLPKKDQESMGREEMIQGLVKISREVYRQGSSQGFFYERKLCMKNWGFNLEQVGYPGVRLWYGKEDVNTPLGMGRYIASRLPNAILKEYEGKTHFSMPDHMEEMLTDMLQDE